MTEFENNQQNAETRAVPRVNDAQAVPVGDTIRIPPVEAMQSPGSSRRRVRHAADSGEHRFDDLYEKAAQLSGADDILNHVAQQARDEETAAALSETETTADPTPVEAPPVNANPPVSPAVPVASNVPRPALLNNAGRTNRRQNHPVQEEGYVRQAPLGQHQPYDNDEEPIAQPAMPRRTPAPRPAALSSAEARAAAAGRPNA